MKLTRDEWDDLTAALVNGELTMERAARRYGVSRQAISAQLKKRPYAHRVVRELSRRRRRNPDESLRRLEREAEGPEGRARLAAARLRAGGNVMPWETNPVAQVFLEAYHLGPEGRVEAVTRDGRKERFYLCAWRLADQEVRAPWSPDSDVVDQSAAVDDSVERYGLVVVPQESVVYGSGRAPSSLSSIADQYNVTLHTLWEANTVSPDWGIPTWWRTRRGWGPRGYYGARTEPPADWPIWLTWAFDDVFQPWYRQREESGAHLVIPPSGRWAALTKTTKQRAGRMDHFGDNHAMGVDYRNYASARIMTRKGKRWKNPPRSDRALRELDRAAAQGDQEAEAKLERILVGRAQPPLGPNERFFYEHAPQSWRKGDPPSERIQERIRYARDLASAEHAVDLLDWQFFWEEEFDLPEDDWCGDRICWHAGLWSGDEVLASLGGIDLGDMHPHGAIKPPYMRVVQAELALEALPHYYPIQSGRPAVLLNTILTSSPHGPRRTAEAGEKVYAIPASNLPPDSRIKWWIRPADWRAAWLIDAEGTGVGARADDLRFEEANPPRAKKALGKVKRAVGRKRLCYPAAEVVYHAGGGRRAGLTPVQQSHEGESHWWVRGPRGEVLDPASGQFKTPVPYHRGRGRGFLTRKPSRRARALARHAGVRLNPDESLRRLETRAETKSDLVRLWRERRRRAPEGPTRLESYYSMFPSLPFHLYMSPWGDYGDVPHSELAMHLGAAGRPVIQFALHGDRPGSMASYARVLYLDSEGREAVADGTTGEVLPDQVRRDLGGWGHERIPM